MGQTSSFVAAAPNGREAPFAVIRPTQTSERCGKNFSVFPASVFAGFVTRHGAP
jgi:hypothetical protein